MNSRSSLKALGLVVLTMSCGVNNDDDRDTDSTSAAPTTSKVLESSTLQTESANMSLTETLDTMADSEVGTGASSLVLANQTKDQDKTKTCEVSGNSAKVTISRELNRTTTVETKKRSIERAVTGSSDVTRTWSHPTTAITCKNNHANIKWDETIANTTLAVTLDRTYKKTIKGTKNGTKIDETHENTSKGTRTVTWKSHTTNKDSTYTRAKTVKLAIDRSHTFPEYEKDNPTVAKSVTVAYSFATPDDAPLAITVIRDSKTHALKSKTVASGTLVAKKDDLKISSTFDNFKIDFSTTKCNPASGSITMKFYQGTSETPTKVWKLTATDSDVTVQNITDEKNPVTVEDFEYTECQLTDFTPE